VAVYCIPIYIMVTLSLKSNADVYTKALALPTNPVWSNYSEAWHGTSQLTLGHALVNSLAITVTSVAIVIVFGSLAAYALARRQSKLSTGLFLLFVSGLIVPFQLGVIPLYVAMRHLSLVGNLYGMILLNIGLLMPLTVFLYTGFIRTLPKEYEEAAQVDGAGLTRTYVRVVFPLLRPVTGTVAVLAGLVTWNEFFLPLIFLSGTTHQPLPVAIYSFVGEFTSQWNFIFAAVAISIAPMLLFFLVAQKQLIRGFTGGIRG
jgi:raffinose/stachyose/melibiose transport system permease protein